MELSAETTTTTESSSESTYESPSFGSMLSSETASAETPAVETAAAAAETPAAAAVETPPVPTVPTPVAAPAAAGVPAIDPQLLQAEVAKATRGIIGALQAERQRRQEVEQQLGGSVPASDADARSHAMQQQLLKQSEQIARLTHKDYDQVVPLALAECANNPALAESIVSSPEPALAAYQIGLNLKLAKEFGPEVMANSHLLIEKVRERARAEMKVELEKEFETKLASRAAERARTPTDISGARAGGGGAVPYVSPAFGEILGSALKRNR